LPDHRGRDSLPQLIKAVIGLLLSR